MDAVGRESRKQHGWLCLLVVVGLLLVFGIFHMLFNSPGQGDTVIEQHPKQIVH